LENSKSSRIDNKKDKDEKTLIDFEIYDGTVILVEPKEEKEIE
jgi:hypothetical protein